MTSAQQDEYRLTGADEDRARAAIHNALTCWDGETGPRSTSIENETLRRLAAHAFGCGLHDLRGSEVQWIDNEIGEQRMGL